MVDAKQHPPPTDLEKGFIPIFQMIKLRIIGKAKKVILLERAEIRFKNQN